MDLCQESTPIIRRTVADKIANLSTKMTSEYFMVEMMPVFKALASDDQDAVRVICIKSMLTISKNLTKDMNKNYMIPILIQMTRDRAWQVRKTLCMNFANIAEVLGTEITDNSLINIFSTLLKDPEGEVRVAAVSSFLAFSKLVSPAKLNSTAQQMLTLVNDTLSLVRAAAAGVLGYVVEHIPKNIVKEKVLPALLELMKTEEDNEVKIDVVNSYTSCGLALGQEFFGVMSQIEIGKLLNETNWRVRRSAFDMVFQLSVGFKSVELFEVHLQEFLFKYLDDGIFAIRKHGNDSLHVNK